MKATLRENPELQLLLTELLRSYRMLDQNHTSSYMRLLHELVRNYDLKIQVLMKKEVA